MARMRLFVVTLVFALVTGGCAVGMAPPNSVPESVAGGGPGEAPPVPANATPVARRAAPEEVVEAITTYAREVLGREVRVTHVGGGTLPVGLDLVLPASNNRALISALKLGVETYAAYLEGGMASLTLGQGSLQGDISGAIKDASLGVFWLAVDAPFPENSVAALQLAEKAFPGLAPMFFTQQPNAFTYLFYAMNSEATATGNEIEVGGRVALVGVAGPAGATVVFAIVGTGEFATALQQ